MTKFQTIEDEQKPLMLKELRMLWEKSRPGLPWAKGEFNKTNTLLLDDSPYKAIRNPVSCSLISFRKIRLEFFFKYHIVFNANVFLSTYVNYIQRHTAIFPYSYRYNDTNDSSLGETDLFNPLPLQIFSLCPRIVIAVYTVSSE